MGAAAGGDAWIADSYSWLVASLVAIVSSWAPIAATGVAGRPPDPPPSRVTPRMMAVRLAMAEMTPAVALATREARGADSHPRLPLPPGHRT
jgi:hypothetical protein